jgi:hypothetical protein
MGTRGAIGYYSQGENKITYNHYDSHPTGLGCNMVSYLESRNRNINLLRKDFDSVKMVDEQGVPSQRQIDICRESGLIDLGVGNQSIEDWYCILRGAQGNLWQNVKCGFMIDSHTFMYDSLFCEWAYVINLDTEMLEIYKGYQKTKGQGRYSLARSNSIDGDRIYFGVSLVGHSSITEVSRLMMSQVEEFGKLPGSIELYNNQDERDDDTISEIESLMSQMLRSNE